MAQVVLASQLARWLPPEQVSGDGAASVEVPGATVSEVLEGLFARHPSLRGYVLDEQGSVRHHVAIFVDGTSLGRKNSLNQPLGAHSEVHVLQALSGG